MRDRVGPTGSRLEIRSLYENVINQEFPDHRHKYCAGRLAAIHGNQ